MLISTGYREIVATKVASACPLLEISDRQQGISLEICKQ